MAMGKNLMARGLHLEANQTFARVQEQDPNYAEAYIERANVLETLGDLRGAKSQWEFAQSLATSEAELVRAKRRVAHFENRIRVEDLEREVASLSPSTPPTSSLPPPTSSLPPPTTTASRPASPPGIPPSSPISSSSSRPNQGQPSSAFPSTTTARPEPTPAVNAAARSRLRVIDEPTRVRFASDRRYEERRFIEIPLEADLRLGKVDPSKISVKYCFFDRDRRFPEEIRLSSAMPINRLSYEEDLDTPGVYRVNLNLPYLIQTGTRAREQRQIGRQLEYHGFFVRIFYNGVEQTAGAPVIRPSNVSPNLFDEKYLRNVGVNGPM